MAVVSSEELTGEHEKVYTHVRQTSSTRTTISHAVRQASGTRARRGGSRISAGTKNWMAKLTNTPNEYRIFTSWLVLWKEAEPKGAV